MIEGARRHGHFDPRWHTEDLRPRNGKADSLSLIRTGEVSPSIRRWENEGGRYSMTDESDEQVDSCIEDPPAGLERYAFLSRYFPYRRRHDYQALKAYEAYRSKVAAPSTLPLTAVVTSRASVIRRRRSECSQPFSSISLAEAIRS
jgi:hypothetical protein